MNKYRLVVHYWERANSYETFVEANTEEEARAMVDQEGLDWEELEMRREQQSDLFSEEWYDDDEDFPSTESEAEV